MGILITIGSFMSVIERDPNIESASGDSYI